MIFRHVWHGMQKVKCAVVAVVMSVYSTEEPGNSKQIFPSENVLLNVLHISVDGHSDKALLGTV